MTAVPMARLRWLGVLPAVIAVVTALGSLVWAGEDDVRDN